MTASLLLQVLANGLVLGGLYACIAAGFSLVWGVLNVINILHGSFIVLGSYVAGTHEVVDNDVCAGQPVSGRTILKSGEDTAEITYDGETDCDDEKQALLTVNDEDRGYVSDITCSVVAPAGGARGGPFALLLALAAPLARRGRHRNRLGRVGPNSLLPRQCR